MFEIFASLLGTPLRVDPFYMRIYMRPFIHTKKIIVDPCEVSAFQKKI